MPLAALRVEKKDALLGKSWACCWVEQLDDQLDVVKAWTMAVLMG